MLPNVLAYRPTVYKTGVLITIFLQNALHGNRDAIHFPRTITQVGDDELILSEIEAAEFAAASDCADGTCTLPATQHMQIQVSVVLD